MGEAHPFPYKVRTSFKLTQYIPTNYNYRSVTTTCRDSFFRRDGEGSALSVGSKHIFDATDPLSLRFISADTPVLKMGPRPPNSGILPCRQFPSPSPPIPPPSNNLSCLR